MNLDEDVEKVFDKFDADGSGDVDKKELKSALQQLGIEATGTQIGKLMAKFTTADVDTLDIETFDKLVSALRNKQEQNKANPNVPVTGAGPSHITFCNPSHRRLPGQQQVLSFYTHPVVEWSVAAIIVMNFLINIIEKEIDPITSKYPEVWAAFELAFNIIFLLELIVNMYGRGGPFKPFWSSGWNVFDFIIVSVGVVLMTGVDLGPGNKLKLLRAFRIFRLFKRIKSLNKIIVAIGRSIPGVMNALLIMLIFFCIYAILAVDLFRDFGYMDGTYMTSDVIALPDGTSLRMNQSVSSFTPRGMHHFSEYYGTFFRALYTLFQVMTGESWSEAVARPLLFGLQQNSGVQVAIFYVSFILLMQFVMINVVVAVLLDKFVAEEEPEASSVSMDDMLDGDGDGSAADTAAADDPEAGGRGATVLTSGGHAKSLAVAAVPALPTPPSAGRAMGGVEAKLDTILQEIASLRKTLEIQSLDLESLKSERSKLAA